MRFYSAREDSPSVSRHDFPVLTDAMRQAIVSSPLRSPPLHMRIPDGKAQDTHHILIFYRASEAPAARALSASL
jgi:hypothetical protein